LHDGSVQSADANLCLDARPGNHFVTVLPFFTATKEFALIRE
jgi:hypothetical protein